VETVDIRKILGKAGLGWMFPAPDEVFRLCLFDLRPINLAGSFDSGFALGCYSRGKGRAKKRTPLGRLLFHFKYQQDQQAGEVLATLLCDFIRSWRLLSSCDRLVTVPPSFKSRPFDPVSVLAQEVERQTGIPWQRNALKRRKLTKPQKEIRERGAKALNVSDVYQLTEVLDLRGKKVLLLDDTFDSGATLDQVSGILKEAGAEMVFALVVAKTQGFF
jgi:predicted amidophosphoribosyltransferase